MMRGCKDNLEDTIEDKIEDVLSKITETKEIIIPI